MLIILFTKRGFLSKNNFQSYFDRYFQSICKKLLWYSGNLTFEIDYVDQVLHPKLFELIGNNDLSDSCCADQVSSYSAAPYILLRPAPQLLTSSRYQTGSGGPWSPWPLWDTEICRQYQQYNIGSKSSYKWSYKWWNLYEGFFNLCQNVIAAVNHSVDRPFDIWCLFGLQESSLT